MELMLVVFALILLATPFATVFLFWRLSKVREQLLKLTELSMEITDGLRRDLLELKRQVESASPVPATAEEKQLSVTPPIKAPSPVEPEIQQPGQVAPPGERKTEVPAEKRDREPAIPAHDFVPSPQVIPPSTVQPLAAKAIEPENSAQVAKPVAPAPPAASPTAQQTRPLPPAVTPPPVSPRQVQPTAPRVPPPPAQASPQIPPSARMVAPTPGSSFRAPAPTPRPVSSPAPSVLGSYAPRPTPKQRMKSVFALEEILGTNWLNKLGIVLVVFGIALFGIYELGQLGPAGKVGLSYAASFALLGGGIFLEKRDRYRVLGRTLIGGGWALLFFTTYALNHVQAMRVMSSQTTDLILMLGVALAMVTHTLRYRSQLVTGLAFLLAYGTVALSNDNVYSLSSGVILAIGLVAIVLKMGWFELEVFGILSSYANHIYWLYRLLGPDGAHGHAFPEYHASTAILLFYWIIYRLSYVLRKTKSPFEEHISTAAALLNTLLLLGAMKFQSVRPELAFMALLIIGAVEFSLGQLPVTRRRREAFVVLSVLGAALMIAAVPFRYSGNNVAILWLVGAEAFLAAGVAVREVVFRRLALFIGLLVGVHLVIVDFPQLLDVRRMNEQVVLASGVIFALCAIVFYLNALFVGQRWESLFADVPDAPMLRAHSYLGAFAAACSAWALFTTDWTAVAFATIMLILAALGRRLGSLHLRAQYGALGVLALYRVAVVNLHSEIPQYTHAQGRLITLPILAAIFYLTTKWAATEDTDQQKTFRALFGFAGTALLTALIYYEVPELWQPIAAIAFAVALLEVGQRIKYSLLAWHAHIVAGLSFLAAFTADQGATHVWHGMPVHAFAALPVVAGAYWIAWRIRVPDEMHATRGRILYTWAGTGVVVWVLNEAVPAPWIAVAWIAFAILLALTLRWIGFRHLAWQANAIAAAAVARSFTFNLELQQPFWQGVSLRLVTVAIVAAGVYFLSRKASVPTAEPDARRVISYLHTFAATILLAFLAWHEAPGGWLAAVWAVFALTLTLVDRRFEADDLRWQAHGLAAITLVRALAVNLQAAESWHGVSIRLLSLALVAVVFYAMSRLIRIPEKFRQRDFHHIYSWSASTLVSLLMWYELQPLSVAVGWALFGLVLFQYGLWRNIKQFRFQAYVALAASFGRIFFANLTAENAGQFWGPRLYTILPVTLILFFVYAQLGLDNESSRDDRSLHFDVLLAYLGTASIVALLYFQYGNEWLVTAWAIVVFALFGIAVALDRPIFLHQALLLTLGACSRGLVHNLFGSSYFTGGDWTGRFFVLGSAVAVLLACLPFAFAWRSRHKVQPAGNWLSSLVQHPEQFMFFAPVLLLTIMLALKMRTGMVTVSWGIEGVSIILLALAVKERSFRLTGLILLLLCVGKVLLMDAWGLQPRDRYITFIILGVSLLLVSFLYSRYREAIRQFL